MLEFIKDLANKDPSIILLIIVVLVILCVMLFLKKNKDSDKYDHNEKSSLIQLAAQTLDETKQQRLVHERHQEERVKAQNETTNEVKMINKSFRDYHVSIVDTIDLTHSETIKRLGGIESIIIEIKTKIDEVKSTTQLLPEILPKLERMLKMFEEIRDNKNVI